MTGQTDHTDVVGERFAAELCAEADLLRCLFQFLLQLDVAECTSVLVAGGGEVVVIFDGGLFDCLKVLFSRCAADYECDVVGGTGCCAEALHFLYEERHEGLGVDYGLCLLIEVGLVGGAAAFCHEHEVIFVAFGSVDVDLRGEIAAGVHLVIHGEGSVLGVAEIVGGVGVVDAARNLFGIVASGEHHLALFAVHDGCSGVLTEGEHTLGCYLGVTQHGEGHVFVVCRSFGVVQYVGHHLIVLAAQHERIVVCGLTG